MIVSEATPATRVCGAVVKASWLATAGFTVSCCVAEARPLAAAVIVGVPANGSGIIPKLTGLPRRGSSTAMRARTVLCRRAHAHRQALPASTGSPMASSSVRVIVLEAMPAVKGLRSGSEGQGRRRRHRRSPLVAEARPPAEAVIVGVPIDVSEYWKLTRWAWRNGHRGSGA